MNFSKSEISKVFSLSFEKGLFKNSLVFSETNTIFCTILEYLLNGLFYEITGNDRMAQFFSYVSPQSCNE